MAFQSYTLFSIMLNGHFKTQPAEAGNENFVS